MPSLTFAFLHNPHVLAIPCFLRWEVGYISCHLDFGWDGCLGTTGIQGTGWEPEYHTGLSCP